MTTRDAANLLIGTNAAGSAKRAADVVETYRRLSVAPAPKVNRHDKLSLFIADEGNNFSTALEYIIDSLKPLGTEESDLSKHLDETGSRIEIGFGRPIPAAFINIEELSPPNPGNPFTYANKKETCVFSHYWNGRQLWSGYSGQRELRLISNHVLLKIALTLAN